MRFDLAALGEDTQAQLALEATGDDPVQPHAKALAQVGTPLLLAVRAIDEDPLQPRREFDQEALQQLADSIAERGVLQAVSVRRHPEQIDRWILNFGARRLRASRLAGKSDIPAFVNETADSYDQVIENEQREGLKPLELALFVQRRLAAGESQVEIARKLGKSPPFVTYATALIDAPDWLMSLYRGGRCRGLRELYELRQLETKHPGCVQPLEADREPITRDRVAALRASVDQKEERFRGRAGTDLARETPLARTTAMNPSATHEADRPVVGVRGSDGRTQARTGHSFTLVADLDGSLVEVVVDTAPADDGTVYVDAADGGARRAVDAGRLRLVRLVSR